ncbi:hypothetical protein AaE_015152 [Aphanomyces astaci]|uniref:Uncharacterized protein n=1 Tax=Aphanomyces astaci TaxID=112090 RepID=A0A6A4Z3N8_APHAT|nr:hypothetical protein AaE_015152 [Aphanomyces astaci]
MKDGKRKRDYNKETRTCMLCGETNVSYRKDSIVKHLIKHRSDEHAQSIEWDGARNPLQPRQHFEEREGVSLPCYIDDKCDTSDNSTSQKEDGGDDFDEHLERLVALPASFHSGVIIRMLGSICKQRGLPLPPMPVQPEATVDEEFQPERAAEVEEPPKPTKRKKTDKVSKLLKHLGHV